MTSIRALIRHSLDVRSRVIEYFGYRSKFLARTLGGVRRSSSFGLDGLDQRLAKRVTKKRGFYVELGANDGVAQSNTLFLELTRGWTGLLIEPVSETYIKLIRNRSSSRNHLVHAACVSSLRHSRTVEIAVNGLMSTPMVDFTDIHDIRSHFSWSETQHEIITERVVAKTLTEILGEVFAPQYIDLLSLDVEGGELEVLQGVDFSQITIEWILVETRSSREMEQFLGALGYELIEKMSHHDYLFRLKDVSVR